MKKLLLGSIVLSLGILAYLPTHAQDFQDVQAEHINIDAIDYLRESKVVEGYSDETYKPENRINRAEFMKIIVASQVQNPTGSHCFTDVKNEWYAKYICTAKRLGWVGGHPDGSFKPADYINFAEASKIITKSQKVTEDKSGTKNEWFAGYVNGLAQKKAIPTSIQFFDKDLSRGEMAEVIWRLKTDETDKVSQTYEDITSPFPAIQSCKALHEKFKDYQSQQYGGFRGPVFFDDVMMEAVDAEPRTGAFLDTAASSPGSAKAAVAEDFSETNVQVSGVDEADIVKNDGKYIYLIKGNTVRIVDAFPASSMKELGELDFTEEAFQPQQMFLNGDQLVVIGHAAFYYPDLFIEDSPIEPVARIAPYPYRGSRTKVFLIDISNRTKPKVERKLAFDGNYSTARRIDQNMFLVLNSRPNFWAYDEVKTGEDLLPRFQEGDGDDTKMVDCSDIHYFPGHSTPSYLIALGIPLDDLDGEVDKNVFLGNSENVYASKTHMYVAASQVNYDRFTDWDWRQDQTKTLVFRFALDDGDIEYKARGSVPGRILNQFSMDAHINHFRIATTQGNLWNEENPSSSNVFILDRNMDTVGKIEGIAPGERIFSTRFLGDRLYMVTFRQVDPLFVIDLSSPTNPKILGSLKIPGFSDYLHPFDEDHIIGFGKDTVEDKDRVLVDGFKMALFDVSDVSDPKQKFVEVIGDRGTNSELLRNHKALLFDKEKELLAFPISIVEKVDPEDLECNKFRYDSCPQLCQRRCIPSDCTVDNEGRSVCTDDCDGPGSCTDPNYERYSTTFSGAVVYDLNDKTGFKQRGKITHYDDSEIEKLGNYWPYDHNKNISRIIYLDDVLYSISPGHVKASDMQTVDEINSIELD